MDLLLLLREVATGAFTDPRFLAALPSLVVSLLIDGAFKKAISCAVIAFFVTPLMMWWLDIPFEGAPGVGVIIAVTGVHGIVDKVRSTDIKSVVEAFKRSGK